MKAVVCPRLSKTVDEALDAMQLTELPRPGALEPNQVRVAVRAASINFPELLMMTNKYQYKPPVPFVLCSEGAGVITEVGGSVKRFKVGEKVLFSFGTHGAAAEEVLVKESGQIWAMPDGMTFSQGAGYFMTYNTAYHGLVQRGALKAGEWLLVTGAAGGVGLAAVQLGKALGAKVIAAASSDEKLEVCKQLGADFVVNYSKENLRDVVSKITNKAFCDVIYEPVGGDVFDQCVRCVATGGGARLLVIGFAGGRIPTLPVNMALIKGFSLVGVRMGAQVGVQPHLLTEMMDALLQLSKKGTLLPYVGAEYPMDKARAAFELMQQRKVVGKCCIVVGPDSKTSKL
mmetsp:Transcript_43630/g.79546  ORF Transcript_43630/g.79546 Transcript_43630/m.79546 type:complete len:344 (+) Transcript_43630:48-1079(+)